MDSLELAIHDTFTERAADAPLFRGMRPRRRRPTAVLASAAAVALVVAVSITLVLIRRSAAPAASSAHWRAISYHGITIKVPARLGVEYGTCGAVRNQVVVWDEITRFCPDGGPVLSGTAVRLNPGHPQDAAASASTSQTIHIDGLSARRGYLSAGPETTGTILIPQLQVVATVIAPSRTRVDAILNTIHVTPIDALGCPDRVSTPNSSTPRSSATATAATAVVVCRYESQSLAPFWLIGSDRLSPAASAAVARLFTAVHRGPPRAHPDQQPAITFVLRYAYSDGSTRSIELRFTNDPESVRIQDGQHSAIVSADLVSHAAGTVL